MKKIIVLIAVIAAVTLLAACGAEKEPERIPYEVIVSVDGAGRVAASPAGNEPVFDDGDDAGNVHLTLTEDAGYTLEARPDEGAVFECWQKDGRWYSDESRIDVVFSSPSVYTAVFGADMSTLRITVQPVTETVLEAPDGFELNVGVNNWELVRSYQWQINNGDHDNPAWVDLKDCSSGRTAALVKPATFPDERDAEYRCVIVSEDGETLVSDIATVRITNQREYVNCIWFSGYAVLPGQTLNLSDEGLGTGTVSLNEKGDAAVLTDVCADSSDPVYDYYDSNLGLCGTFFNYPYETFTVRIEGTNIFTNTYWQEEENSGGIPVCFNFLDDSKCTDLIFEGDGTLTLTGGTHMIYSNTKVTVKCDMNFGKIGDRYTTGIYAYEIEIAENVSIDADLNGFLLRTRTPEKHTDRLTGAIVIKEGAVINAVCSIPVISVGSTDFHVVSAMNGFEMDGGTLNMLIQADGRRFDERHGVAQIIALQAHFGDIAISDGSAVNAVFSACASDSGHDYVFNGCVLNAEEGSVFVTDSEVRANAQVPWVWNFAGVYAKDVTLEKSFVVIDVKARGSVLGFSMQGVLRLTDSAVHVDAFTYTELTDRQSFGIIATGLEMDESSYVRTNATDIAVAIQTGAGDTERRFEEDYVPTVFSDLKSEGATANVWSMEGAEHNFVYFETFYGDGCENPANFALISR